MSPAMKAAELAPTQFEEITTKPAHHDIDLLYQPVFGEETWFSLKDRSRAAGKYPKYEQTLFQSGSLARSTRAPREAASRLRGVSGLPGSTALPGKEPLTREARLTSHAVFLITALPSTPSATEFHLDGSLPRTLSAFFPAQPAAPSALSDFSWDRFLAILRRRGTKPLNREGLRAYDKFSGVARWLGVSHEELADALGIKRTTPYAWGRGDNGPRPATGRKLQALYAITSALAQRLGGTGVTEWLNSGQPSPREQLLADDLAAVQTAARPVLFTHVDAPRPGALIADDEPDEPPPRRRKRQ